MSESMEPPLCASEPQAPAPHEQDQKQQPEKKQAAPASGGYERARGNMLGSGN